MLQGQNVQGEMSHRQIVHVQEGEGVVIVLTKRSNSEAFQLINNRGNITTNYFFFSQKIIYIASIYFQ
jgi:hypothetical protein